MFFLCSLFLQHSFHLSSSHVAFDRLNRNSWKSWRRTVADSQQQEVLVMQLMSQVSGVQWGQECVWKLYLAGQYSCAAREQQGRYIFVDFLLFAASLWASLFSIMSSQKNPWSSNRANSSQLQFVHCTLFFVYVCLSDEQAYRRSLMMRCWHAKEQRPKRLSTSASWRWWRATWMTLSRRSAAWTHSPCV